MHKIRVIDTDAEADADGRLSRDEHAAGSNAMFSKMDGNGHASLTAAEFQAGHDRVMGG